MNTTKLYVIDTNTIVRYFDDVFLQKTKVSNRIINIMQAALSPSEGNIKISIPSIVFVEIFEKWLRDEELSRKFFYEVFYAIKESPNIEIKPIDKEVLQELLNISGSLENHDLHDKIVLASAISLESSLITNDSSLVEYVEKTRCVPEIIN